MIKKYFKKPVVVEAVQFTGDNGVWIQENFCPKFKGQLKMWLDPTERLNKVSQSQFKCWIETEQGNIPVKIGDYIVKENNGKFYSYDKGIFQESYQKKIDTVLVKMGDNFKYFQKVYKCFPGYIVKDTSSEQTKLMYVQFSGLIKNFVEKVYIPEPLISKDIADLFWYYFQTQKKTIQEKQIENLNKLQNYAKLLRVDNSITEDSEEEIKNYCESFSEKEK